AHLVQAHLGGAHLDGAELIGADLIGALIGDADFSEATCGSTSFAEVDLSKAKGLESIKHIRTSALGADVLVLSEGEIPELFLQGCGVPEALMTYLPSIKRARQPIHYCSCFISFCAKDTPFANRLHADLQ